MPLAWTQTTAPTCRPFAVTRASRSLRARPELPTTPVSQDRNRAALGHQLLQPHQAGILEGVALLRQLVLPDAEPQQRHGPPVAGDQAQHQSCLPVTVV